MSYPVHDSGLGPIRFGAGDLGGRARGLDFVAREVGSQLAETYQPHRVSIDRPLVLCTDIFETFLERNELEHCVHLTDDDEVRRAFARGDFSWEIVDALIPLLDAFDGPLELRSSTLREDNSFHPFSGIYHWEILPNDHPDPAMRVSRLLDAVKRVYASIFLRSARRILAGLSTPLQEERMAVVVHRVPGRRRGDLFFPTMSGLVQAQNFFPVGPQAPQEGICHAVLGHWTRSLSQDHTVRFSPVRPLVRPEMYRARDVLSQAQRTFYAVDLRPGRAATPLMLPIEHEVAARDLPYVASTWVAQEELLLPGTMRDGRRVITAQPLLSGGMFPLAEALAELLMRCWDLYGIPVELRFALNMFRVDGRPRGELVITQVLPQLLRADGEDVELPSSVRGRVFLDTPRVMGHGRVKGLRNILYVPPVRMSRQLAVDTALALARINDALLDRGESALLIGPGRWGSSNPDLGIPVTFPQIRSARAICEVASGPYNVAPSQGTHFFRNITLGNVLYLSVIEDENDLLDAQWLAEAPATEHGLVRHIVPEQPVTVAVDGMRGRGLAWMGAD